MDALSQFILSVMEKYTGPDHTIAWTRLNDPKQPMEYLIFKSHPNPNRNMDMYFFLNYNWVEIYRDQNSVYDGAPISETVVIEMSLGTNWQQRVIDKIESWLEYKNGCPPWEAKG